MAFTGRATYDNTTALAEDVSDIVSMISPFETPLLDFLGDAARPATNTLHEWLEESLGPPSIIASTAINSATASTTFRINGTGGSIQIGDLVWTNRFSTNLNSGEINCFVFSLGKF